MSPKPESMKLELTGEGVLGDNYRLKLDNTDVSARVRGVTVSLDVGEVNEAFIRYACDRVEIEGDFKIVHQCPLMEDPA